MKTEFYPLADPPAAAELRALGFAGAEVFPWKQPFRAGHPGLVAVKTAMKRWPETDEWFLSGAMPEAYKAVNDLDTEYHILRLVRIETTTTSREIEVSR